MKQLVSVTAHLVTIEQEIFARFIFRILHDLTEFTKVYPVNLLI